MAICSLSLSTNFAAATPIPKPQKQIQSHKTQTLLNSTLQSLSKSGKLDEALHLLLKSHQHQQRRPSLQSYAALLHACISTKSLRHGRTLYLHLLQSNNKKDLLKNPTLKSKFITLFAACGQLDEARRAFHYGIDDGTGFLHEPVYVAMAIGFSKNRLFREALVIYCEMLSAGVEPGNFAFSVALKACSGLSDVRNGKSVHAQIVKAGEDEPDQVVYNALLKLYSDCGCFDEHLKVFNKMPERNVAAWNALVAGLVKKDKLFEALGTFRKMQRENVGFSWVSLTTVLSVCARLSALYIGKEVHGQIIRSSESPDTLVLNSLLDMYAKCGEIEYCRKVFDKMLIKKDLTTWNILINGYAINGSMNEAITVFERMVEDKFKPDEVTFVSLLSGFSRAGMDNEGRILFSQMSLEFGVNPNSDHYACLVDMLGRAGKIEEALGLVKKMPTKPNGSVWGSLLNSCKIYGHVSLAEAIAKMLFEIEPTNPGNYIILSSIYSNAGMWDKVRFVKELMDKKGIKEKDGFSHVQIRDKIYRFRVCEGFEKFRDSDEFRKKCDELTNEMEKNGVFVRGVNEESKVEWVCGHSERLATVFGLICTGDGLPIRITKNIRVCGECHSWMKHASRLTERKIILRDTNRLHRFERGKCSCDDYW
ncbi:pentatricopeptide repeat-containing protein at3g14330 [Phtheirospermum japonicum]|uniref:Pentatricopeptide repeat-containing protein at3g14330 n=1 Tax=Phtheirospermum japonicum TaxID=374723 RepID=A0A830B6X8_9LAMI|nr:pentatricopeptide repeat-containing protein at3g14330 [Phtheirospermum japonicum]